MNTSHLRPRLLLIFLLILALFAALIWKYYTVQIKQGDRWERVARRQHFFIVSEPFVRGTLYSNSLRQRPHPDQPQKLVLDIQKYHLFADPAAIAPAHHAEIAKALKQALSLTDAQQRRILSQLQRVRSRSRRLILWIDPQVKEELLRWWSAFAKERHIPRNALFFVADYQRSYPYGKLLGHALQTVQQGRDEKTGQAQPTGGLELSLNRWLNGRKGKRRLMRSPRNALEMDAVILPPENGCDVFLTVNHILQAIAEDEIEKAVKRTRAKSGWAVMMDPHTGEILALAQYPFLYPSRYAEAFADPSQRQEIRVKAISDAHEPGSVMKPVTLAVALMANEELRRRGESPLFSPDEKMATLDGQFPGRKPLKEITYHRYLNMNMGLWKSSNIYMARLIQRVVDRLGVDWYRGVLHQVFGFGSKTGIELPGESSGVLPTPGKTHANGALEWSTPTPFSLAIGHNIQTTSLQLVRAYAMLANGGRLVTPTLLRQIARTLPDGQRRLLLDYTTEERKKTFPQLMQCSTIGPVVNAMKYVTKKGGSAFRADIPGYTQAGKTGTAEKIVDGVYSKSDHVATFIGFAPVNNPAFVLLVSVDEPEKGFIPGVGKRHMGGYAAAPVFREIAKRSLAYLGVPPDDPYGYPEGDPRYDPDKADWVHEVTALQKLYDQWNRS